VNQRKKAMRKLEKSRTSPNRLPDPPSLKPAESALKSILGVSNKDSDSVYSVDSKSSSPSPHPKKNARQNPKKEKAKQPVQKQKQPRSRQQGKQEGAYPSEKTEEMTFHQPVPTSSGQDMLQKLFNSQQYMEQPTFAQNQYSQEPLNQQQQFMQQLFHQQQTKSQSPSETPPSAHRASFVEELLKSKAGMQSPSTEVSSSNSSVIGENARRNSLLNVLQGRASAEPPTTNPLQALLNGNAPIVRANYE
jgi:hypothetical protein